MKERTYDNLKAQADLDDKNIREVIAEAEKIAGVRCFMPWQKFVIAVMHGDNFDIPEPEQPQWWYQYYPKGEWIVVSEEVHNGEVIKDYGDDIYGIGVWGTIADRDEKRDALLEAARKAGKP